MRLPKKFNDALEKLGISSSRSVVIGFKPDPEFDNVFMVLTRQATDQGCNETDDNKLDNLAAHIVFIDRVDSMKGDNVGESIVKHFPDVLYDLGYSWAARAEMFKTKNYTSWAQFRVYDYEYNMF